MSSSICAHFTQNAWKKDLCSNCFKSKDEHKAAAAAAASKSSGSSHKAEAPMKTDYPNKNKTPAKSIIKKAFGVRLTSSSSSSSKSGGSKSGGKVCFPKQLHEIIGYGGEWSDDDDDDDDHDFMNLGNEHDDMAITETDDEETVELKRITRANTDFNMNNGNLLGDAEDNIKKSFAALKLGAPQVDKEGKKQTLTINVMPFGQPLGKSSSASPAAKGAAPAVTSSAGATPAKAKPATVTTTTAIKSSSSISSTGTASVTKKVTTTLTPTLTMAKSSTASAATTAAATTTSSRDGKDSPPIERAMEKSLLDEISETLEQNHKQSETGTSTGASSGGSGGSSHVSGTPNKIKFELSALSDVPKPFLDLKKPIARNPPITRDQAKPKVNVCHKYSDTDSNCSDTENGVSAYYDVVETQLSYENLPDGKYSEQVGVATAAQTDATGNSHYSSSQYITDMLLSSKTRAASYNLHEGNFMTSKITSDGLIVTKCSSDDALDSTGSSFDGSSDEENAYNMIRSESDSGIGISLGSEYKNVGLAKGGAANQQLLVEKKLSASTNNSDYEDIQIGDQAVAKPAVKSRELHGEPDGSADPDNSLEQKQQQKSQQKEPAEQQQVLPALPKSPPPPMKIDARPSFLHGLKKPELPVKPLVTNGSNSGTGSVSGSPSPLKSFLGKRQPSCAEQQFISQLQSAISKSSESLLLAKESLAAAAAADEAKLKKGKAPNPPPEPKLSAPPTPERDYSLVVEFEQATKAAAKPAEKTTSPGSCDASAGDKSTPVTAGSAAAPGAATGSPSANNSSLYTRKPALPAAGAAPVIREKDKRERAVINPKFRSLNTFVMQRANAAKQLQLQSASSVLSLKQPMTPEPTPRNQRHLSMSEECLAAAGLDKKSSSPSASPPQKQKSKFSIKKFLRMGSNSGGGAKSGESLGKKESSIYTEICTGTEEGSASGKPRLVIIHPIDINPTAVEVVKDITKTSDSVSAQTVAVVTSKPPAPPLRSSASEGQRAHEANKPARPPPPKSAELRRKQKTELTATLSASSVESSLLAAGNGSGSVKLKADNVYANLGKLGKGVWFKLLEISFLATVKHKIFTLIIRYFFKYIFKIVNLHLIRGFISISILATVELQLNCFKKLL